LTNTPIAGDTAAVRPCALTFTVTTTAADTVVAVAGEVDTSCAEEVRTRLTDELTVGANALIADLTAVPFCDSSGLSVLLDAHSRAAEEGVPFVVVSDQRGLLKPIRMLHLDAVLTIHPTLAAARAALGTGS
jgi:anti-sigma B factor antagonist